MNRRLLVNRLAVKSDHFDPRPASDLGFAHTAHTHQFGIDGTCQIVEPVELKKGLYRSQTPSAPYWQPASDQS